MPGRTAYLLTVLMLLTSTAGLAASPAAIERVREAQFSAPEISGQALALAHLAWIDEDRDPEAAALAREKLVGYGESAFDALFVMTDVAPQRFKADVTAMLIETRRAHSELPAPTFLPALDRAIWFGSRGSRRLAIRQAAKFRFRGAMLPSIDAAYEDPVLRPLVLRILPAFGHAGARFFLREALLEGTPEERVVAANSMVQIGGRAIEALRDVTLSENRDVRETAIRALLPSTAINDLTTLHEYVYTHPDDDPELIQRIRDRAAMLEKLLEQEQEQDSSDDF